MEYFAAAVAGVVLAALCIGMGWGMAMYQIELRKEKDGK